MITSFTRYSPKYISLPYSLPIHTPLAAVIKTAALYCLVCIAFVFDALGQTYDQQAGSGFGNLHFGQDGSLGQVFTPAEDGHTGDLRFRRYTKADGWGATEVVTYSNSSDAALFHVNRGQGSAWEVIHLGGYGISHYTRNMTGEWLSTGYKSITRKWDFGKVPMISVSIDSNNVYHIAFLEGGDTPSLKYLRYDGRVWTETVVYSFDFATTLSGFDSPHQDTSPRMLSIGVSASTVHIVASGNQSKVVIPGGTAQRSDLYYFTAEEGVWEDPEIILSGGSSDDAGLGASLCVAPDGTVAVAATYLPRAVTGSPGIAQLRYLYKQANGDWHSEMISNIADNYFSRDGQRGTGLYPYLVFDGESKPHIVFTDHASEHAGTAWSYAGQMRYATRNNPLNGIWQISTRVRQPTWDAFLRRLEFPVIAASRRDDQVAFFADHAHFDESNYEWNHTTFFLLEGDPADAYEENDSLSDAYLLETEGLWLSEINGVGLQSDEDWYAFSAPAGTTVKIDCQFTHSEGNIDISLIDSSGNVIGSSASASDDEQVINMLEVSGTYYIRVDGGDSGNGYDLRWKLTDDLYEQNDRLSDAYLLHTSGLWLSEINGLGVQADEDWYAFSASAGDSIQVECRFTHTEGDINIALIDSSGNVLVDSDSTSNDEQIIKTLTASGTYYIRVDGGGMGNEYDLRWHKVGGAIEIFTTGGDAEWFNQELEFRADGDALQSGDIADNEESWLETVVSGPGTLRFWWKVSSERGYDYLRFYLNGSEELQISGAVGWEQREVVIESEGDHVLRWTYRKDGSASVGGDAGWVDGFEWISASDTPYQTAVAAAGLSGDDALPSATPFNDGVRNLLKFAFNMNLAGLDSSRMALGGNSGLPSGRLIEQDGQNYLRVEFVERIGSGLVYTAKKSSTLEAGSFIPVSSSPQISPIDTQWQRVIYDEPCDPSTEPRCFIRVDVE